MRIDQARGLTMAFSSGLLTAAGAETVHDTTVTITFSIDGVLATKTAITDGATPTTDANTGAAFAPLAADKACVFVWMLNASGTVKVAQGPIVAVDGDTDEPKTQVPLFPPIPAGHCPFAYQKVQTAGTSSAWTFGTSNWNATGVTDVIKNISTLPARPSTDAVS